MTETKTGLVVVASQYESGGQRARELTDSAKEALEKKNIRVITGSKVIWDGADAIDVCKELKEEEVDSLTIVLSTWVTDSLLYILVQEMQLPVVFWAVPYTETFSIGCVQHFGSALTTHGIPYDYVYGLADQEAVVEKVAKIAEAGRILKSVKNMKLALVGPRQTWRVAGPQDTTNEEWEFSQKFGVTLIHIEMEEILELAGKISEEEAVQTYKYLRKRTGKVLADEETMLHMTSVYLAVKEIVKKYSLDALAAECYPFYSGQMNLPSSWLADEGIIVDTEGDIGHTMVMYMLNLAAKGGATALGEVGSMDDENRILALAHEGSTAHSLAEDLSKVQISPSGEKGCFVGLPLRPMEKVTVSSIQGNGRDGYQILVESGRVVEAHRQEWIDGGEKLLVKLGIEKKASEAVDRLIEAGMDHHLLVKEGDYTEILSLLCKYLKVKKVTF
ncbi:hypothetical protein B5F53_12255 [Blautia sp. An249]|uniref:hypothetical protein n=1 Tax=Blautia sp. An249 TaxID=1965603 RepID=UPI000B38A6D4|nr:hypothetical protein [Blautia sp. An249]OUO77973.1 hypothetical protein B5F53_12255 [Blautia sp. An249]